MDHNQTIKLNHTFRLDKSRNFRIDFTRVKSVEDVVLILSKLDIRISVPRNISESQFAAIEKFLVKA
jgi:hypothetical protein